MKMTVVIIALAASFLFAGQTAFAQDALAQDASTQTSVSEAHATVKTTKRVVKTVRKPLPGQKKTIRTMSHTRVIHNANLGQAKMNAYLRSAKKTSTPNLFRN